LFREHLEARDPVFSLCIPSTWHITGAHQGVENQNGRTEWAEAEKEEKEQTRLWDRSWEKKGYQ
jgi:hypothetical protein